MKSQLIKQLAELEKEYVKEMKKNLKLAHERMFPYLTNKELKEMISNRKQQVEDIRFNSLDIVTLWRKKKK